MKKILLLTLSFIIVLSTFAQTEHLQFMGIPIDGSISSFTKQLKKKGFIKDKLFSSFEDYLNGCRVFIGTFAGEKRANVVVFYDIKTKQVNNVKVLIKCYSENELNRKYESFLSQLKLKYSSSILQEKTLEEEPGTEFVISDANGVLIGLILLYKGIKNDNYNLSLEYTDFVNVISSSRNDMNDL